MNDPEPFDGLDPHLSDRMERAVGGLRAPDVAPRAMARGRRQRTHRRLAYGAGGLAAATALVVSVPAFANGWPGAEQDAASPAVAADPAPSSPTSTPATAPTVDGGFAVEACGAAGTEWWSKSSAQITTELETLLPEGVRVGETDDGVTGEWRGTLVAGDDADFASLTLLPPPGILGPTRTLEEVSRLGRCGGGANEPAQAVKPCDEVAGVVACAEIRSEDGVLVGVVTENVESSAVDGQEQPTDRSYFLATLAGPQGGYVELTVAEGTSSDRPNTVHDPADVPALTMKQVRAIITDAVWTS